MTSRRLLTALLVVGIAAGGTLAALGGQRSSAPADQRAMAVPDSPAGTVLPGSHRQRLLAAGDATRWTADITRSEDGAETTAREIHRSELRRARQQESLDGVLQAAEALAAVGDPEGAKEGMRIAKALAGSDPEAQADVRATASRVGDSRC
jgi:hypothetical protein